MNRPEPPQLTSGRKSDPLHDAFHAPSSAPTDGRNALFKSPPPRFSDHGGAIVAVPRASTTPSHVGHTVTNTYAASQITEVTAFSRSEVADKIRQSFDALVKASPIGVPMISRTAASPYPMNQRIPPLRSSFPSYPQANNILAAPHSGGGGSGQQGIQHAAAAAGYAAAAYPAPPQQAQQAHHSQQTQHQVVETHEFRRTVHSNSPMYGATTSTVRVVRQVLSAGSEGGEGLAPPAPASHGPSIEHPDPAVSTFQCEEIPQDTDLPSERMPREVPSEAAAAGVSMSVSVDDPSDINLTHGDQPQGSARPTSAPTGQARALSEGRKKESRLGSAPGGSRPPGKRRELAALLTPRTGGHATGPMHLSSGTAPATMPVRSVHGDELDEERMFEVTRFGRPRVKPLAYWSSERLVVGTKDAGAQGIDKGSASGDLLITQPQSGKGRPNRSNHSNSKGKAPKGASMAAVTTAAAVHEGQRNSTPGGKAQSINVEGKSVQKSSEQKTFSRNPARRVSGGATTLAAVAAAAGAEAAAIGGSDMIQQQQQQQQQQPEIDTGSPVGAVDQERKEQKRSTTPAIPLPEVAGVPEAVVRQLADMPSEDRPKKCGHCRSCLKPSLRKACETIRALGGNAPIPRGKNRLSLGAGGGAKKRPHIEVEEAVAGEQGEAGEKVQKRGTRQKRILGEGDARRSTRQEGAGEEQGAAELATSSDAPQRPQNRQTQNKAAAAAKPVEKGDSGPWTAEQVAALHKGWLEVPPTASNFWQKVAAIVPGRTAAECFSKMYERHPTPPQKKGHAAGAAGAKYRGGAVAVPELKPGASKHTLQNAARKYARQQRWQQRAEEVASVAGDEEEMVEALEEQQHRDRYIDQILRGRALGVAPHGRARGGYGDDGGGGENKAGAGAAVQRAAGEAATKDVQEALAAATANAKEDENADSDESDYYWSDAE